MRRTFLTVGIAALALSTSAVALGVASGFDVEKARTIASGLAQQVVAHARAAAGDTEPAKPASAPAAPAVQVVTVASQDMTQWEEYTGRFEAVDHVEVRARVSGYLETVHFEAGQKVKRGDLLFTIDRRPFEARVAEARAALDQARAAVTNTRNALARAQKLTRRGHTSRATLDERQEQFATAQAGVAAGEARLRSAELELEFTEIRSPVDGRISDDAVTVGNLIASGAGSPVLTTIVSSKQIHFVFDATEQQLLSRMRDGGAQRDVRERLNGAPVEVRLIDETDFAHQGYVDFIDNQIDRLTGTIRGRAVLENVAGILTPGMFGRMRIAETAPQRVALIPDKAIGTDQTQKFVWVLDSKNKAQRRHIQLGNKRGLLRVVTAGLTDGERVVTSGLHRVASGRAVTPQTTRLAQFKSTNAAR